MCCATLQAGIKVPHTPHRSQLSTTTTTTTTTGGPVSVSRYVLDRVKLSNRVLIPRLRAVLNAFAPPVNAAVRPAPQLSKMVSQEPAQPDATSISELDDASIYTPTATTENGTPDLKDHASTSWVPSDGSTVIIRSTSCGNVLTLLDGNIVLAPPSGRGSILWECVESEGWFGFRNCVSGKFICHGWDARLKCSADQQDGWRHFTITPVPKGGYIMQMSDWWTLRPIVINAQNGVQKLGRTGNKLSEGIVWNFLESGAGNAEFQDL